MNHTTWLKGMAVITAFLMLSACSDDQKTAKDPKTEESQTETPVKQELTMQESSEEEPTEQEPSTVDGENKRVYLSEEFLSQLKDGKMSGSKIQFTHSIEDVKKILGEPESTEGIEGGEILLYGTYGYVKPSLENRIVSIYYFIPAVQGVTGEDFANAWGEPQSKGELEHPYSAYSMTYHLNDKYIVNLEMDDSQQGIVKFLNLTKIGK